VTINAAPTLDRAIRDVADAMSLDDAVDAYAEGLAIDPGSAALHRAYVRRVVDLGAPQLAASAAERLLASEPNNGLARAVLADAEAHQGNFADALTDISLAVPRAADEPFVQTTAAHLLAWYDNNPSPPALPSYTRRSLALAHGALGDYDAYNTAYTDASNFYQDEKRRLAAVDKADAAQTTQPTTQPSTSVVVGPPPEPVPDLPDYAGYTGAGIGYVAAPYGYYQPYSYGASYYEPYYYAYPYYTWWPDWWFPGGALIALDNFHHNHHDHDHDGDHHHHHNIDDHFRDRFFGGGSGGVARGGHGAFAGGQHLDELRSRVDGLQIGASMRSGNRGASIGFNQARGLNPADPHFRGANGRFSGNTFVGRGPQNSTNVPNVPGPLTNLPGPLSNIPPPPGEHGVPTGAAATFNNGVPAPPPITPGSFQQIGGPGAFAPSGIPPAPSQAGGSRGGGSSGGGRGGHR
jgi:tetratricopeptide (TPR) repeat protein